MKLTTLTASLLLAPAASYAIQLPFKLPAQLAGLEAALNRFELPTFLSSLTAPSDSEPVLALHRSLCEIPSVTYNESAVGTWLASYLTSRNFTVETQVVDGDRQNVFAYLGSNRTTHTLVTSHIDTVPPFIPYRVVGNTIYGRGTNDAKGSVAAQITAVEEMVADGTLHEGDVSMLFVVDEEKNGNGMRAANNLPGAGWKAVIFGEPTELKLAVGHKGIIMVDVHAAGKASHSGYPQLGVNANTNLIKALAVLDSLELPASELLGNTTLNIGRMEGGVAANVIPANASASLLIRVAGDLDETVAALKNSVAHLPVTLQFSNVVYGPVMLDHEVEGFETAVMSYGTDVPNLKGDHKKYLYGPGSILTAHGDNEFVLKSDLIEAVAGYKTLVKQSLWPTKRVPAVVAPEVIAPVVEELPTAVSSPAVVIESHVVESVVIDSAAASASNESTVGSGEL
ncbi:hypothetical protein EDC01DRAFT_168032 [Geopyxis carbonaria]|nr:hypothetical protein EDC01DRAFT_168032 [Geopyxis carbonaria]